MNWENLTAEDFREFIKVSKGVAIIPYGCLEKHGYHLPLGTDMFIAKNLAEQACKIEEALVVPIAPYGIISEATHTYGCLSISSHLQYEILEELCDELARNGYHKIIIINGHGGGTNFLKYFAQSRLEKPHDYVVCIYNAHNRSEEQDQKFLAVNGPMDGSGHADVKESSEICYLHPELVHLDRIDQSPEQVYELGRLNNFANVGLYSAIGWYADHPHHIAGNPIKATAEKGKILTDIYVENLAKAIKAFKEDDTAIKLTKEFYSKRFNQEG